MAAHIIVFVVVVFCFFGGRVSSVHICHLHPPIAGLGLDLLSLMCSLCLAVGPWSLCVFCAPCV